MQRANVLGTAFFVAGASICAAPIDAQTEVSADLGLYSS
jgi:hypothetical protein